MIRLPPFLSHRLSMNPMSGGVLRLDTPAHERIRLVAMMALFFLVVCAVGILRPIKNSLALDGLGATSFYKVYLVSAFVVLFVPLFTRAADRFSWRWMLPGVALFFSLNLVAFRVIYVDGSALFGLAFYGWYDLFAAALVTQFFMATQLFFDARSAKKAYPLVIAGGSLGATLGGGITGFFAESVGTPNLMLIAAGLIATFAVAMPWVWGSTTVAARRSRRTTARRSELVAIFSNRHVQLIAVTVLLTVLVKQLVDFQFNALTKEVFETRDAVSAFQGKFNAATQWLPLVVLAALRPALQRWGVGAAVLLLPVAMVGATAGLAIAFGLWAAVAAKGSETALRYSAERAGREILYVPIPDEIKLKAKAYIDVAVEKGAGKVLSAGLIALLLMFTDVRGVAVFSVALAVVWLALALSVRREYVRTLARAIDGRFASLKGLFVTLTDASSVPVLRVALDGSSPRRAAFALELLGQAPASDIRTVAPELNRLATHTDERIRALALEQLARIPDAADEAVVRACLRDNEASVREAAVRVLVAGDGDSGDGDAGDERGKNVLAGLLDSPDSRVRTAALAHMASNGGAGPDNPADRGRLRSYVEARRNGATDPDPDTRAEMALAAAGLRGDPDVGRFLDPFLDDPDARVRATALRSAGLLGRSDCINRMIEALAVPATRSAAADALITLEAASIAPLTRALLDEATDARVRRAIPGVMARIPHQATVNALLELVLAPATDQLLDFRSLKALGKLRAHGGGLVFDRATVLEVADRELAAAERYATAAAALASAGPTQSSATASGAARELLAPALVDAWQERREGAFRCLGLLYPAHEMYRAWLATRSGIRVRRANALEWIEQTVGNETYRRFAPIIEPLAPPRTGGPAGTAVLDELDHDGDSWIALLARASGAHPQNGTGTMELIEKVFLLQGVDLLQGARGSHLALLASIAEETEVPAGTVLMAAGEPTAAMYIVIRGEVALRGVGEEMRVGPERAFGTWALIDENPSPLEATTTEPTLLLSISRPDLHDLLADHSELGVALLKGLANRMRNLVA